MRIDGREEHLAEDLLLSDIAAVVHLSPYHFARLFKESVGFPPHQYVIQRRVERAKLLLSTTNWSLTAIAHTVGFAHESHLALHFKRLTGVTPRYYRSQRKNLVLSRKNMGACVAAVVLE